MGRLATLVPSLLLLTCASPTAAVRDVSAAGDDPNCQSAEQFSTGMEHLGSDGRFTVRIDEATPAPPLLGSNTWRLSVSQGGVPSVGVVVVVEASMPTYHHGTLPKSRRSVTDPEGKVIIDSIQLFRPGLWNVAVYVTGDDGHSDLLAFRFCIAP